MAVYYGLNVLPEDCDVLLGVLERAFAQGMDSNEFALMERLAARVKKVKRSQERQKPR
jgi:hypothetical protein